ncbi:MAG: 50S ribosomal protein L21e [Candidatus Thorarchaeota archaeon]
MVKRSHGYRVGTRKMLTKKVRERGMPSLGKILHTYLEGDRVDILINPAIHGGQPHKRYHGRVGIIQGRRGRAYEVETTLGNKTKLLIIRPEHLRPSGKQPK